MGEEIFYNMDTMKTLPERMGQMEPSWLGHYEAGVPLSLEVPPLTLPGILAKTAARFPKRSATIFLGGHLSYAALDAQVNRFATALLKAGLQPGERVAICLPNCPQFIVGLYGAWRAGAVAVPLNPLYKEEELATALQHTGARTILTLTKFYPTLAGIGQRLSLERTILTSVADYLPLIPRTLFNLFRAKPEGHAYPARNPTTKGVVSYGSFLRQGRSLSPGVEIHPEDLALLQHTGGTTGHPKAARLTQQNLVANLLQGASFIPGIRSGEEVFAAPTPFFHVLGLTAALNLPIYLGASILPFPRFNAREVLEGIVRHRATIFIGVPAMFVAMGHLRTLNQADLTAMRFFISGAAPLPPEVKHRFEETSGARIVEGYGLTEASPTTHLNPVYGTQKTGSIGLPLPGTEAKIVSLDDPAREVAPGTEGELLVRGPQVMEGYWNDPQATDGVLQDGWLATGDIATADGDGYFYIVDRKKDLVIVGGYNVYPREIEDFLYQHPSVKEAAAFGVPHPLRGEVLAACIVLKDGATSTPAEIIRHCRENLPSHKVPRRLEFVAEIPKTLVGKPLRRALREREAMRDTKEKVT